MNENKYMHVLDWSEFTKDTNLDTSENNCNVKKSQMNKGILFEDLIEELLVAMFPNEIWLRTPKSYDGKKDFVYPADTYLPEQKWAECKNYSSNLSLNVVSPTLIMGAIDDIECIYFFSHSPLNDNAIEGVLSYSKSSNKSIKVFDGNLLENLICKYYTKNSISKFFKNTNFEKAITSLEKKKLRVIRTLKDMNGNIISSDHLFEVGETFYLTIIIQNLSSNYIEYDLDLKFNKNECIYCEKYHLNDGLPFGEIKSFSVLCHTLKPGNLSYIINIMPKSNKPVKENTIKNRGTLKIIDEQYLFWSGENALKVLDNCKFHLMNYKKEPLIVTAESGTGKSTLLNILMQNNDIHKKYKILKLDLNLTRNYCARNLFCQTFDIHENNEIPPEQIEDDKKALSILINGYAESAKTISHIIMSFYNNSRPFLFVVDDIQKISRAYIDLFEELNVQAKKYNKPIYYIFALNNEVLSIDDILIRLNFNYYYRNDKFRIETLQKFNQRDAISFLKHKFGLTDIEQYFDNFYKKISPLELYSFAIDLKNNHIISQIPETSSYQIVDAFTFAENINKILYSNISIKNICKSFGDIPEYVLKYLYITEEIGTKFKNKYLDAINELIILGILKETNGFLSFRHDKIKDNVRINLTFTEEDYVDIFCDENIDVVSKAICAINQIDKINDAVVFLKEFFCSNHEIRKASQKYQVCWLVFEYLDKLLNCGIATEALAFVYSNFHTLNLEQSYDAFFAFLDHIINSVKLFNWDINDKCVEYIAYFIKKYFDRALSMHNNKAFDENYLVLYNLLLNAKHISYERKNYWLSHYSNRTAIAFDRASEPLIEESRHIADMYKESEKYCKKAGNCAELLLQIIVDNFNRHYIYRHNLNKEIVDSSLRELLNLKRENLTRLTCLDYHILLLKYLQLKLDKSNKNQKVILNNLKIESNKLRLSSKSAFYTLKLFILEIYILLDLNNYIEANNLLSEAFSLAYKKGMRQSIYKLTYIRAHLLEFDEKLGNRLEMHAQMCLALEQLMDTRGKSSNDLKREIFLITRLFQTINTFAPEFINKITKRDVFIPLQIFNKVEVQTSTQSNLLTMKSYFMFNDISFPNI